MGLKLNLLIVLGLLLAGMAMGCGGGTATVTVTSGEEPGGSGGAEVSETSGSQEAKELQEKIEAELAEEESGEAEDGPESSPSASGECEEKEINTNAHKTGTCTEEGVTVVVSNMNEPVKLKTLEARLTGKFVARKTISSDLGSKKTTGVFVTFPLKIRNLSHAPVEVSESQVVLLVNENIYTQSFEVQNGYEQKSFSWERKPVQPEGSLEGTATFDLPKSIVSEITQNGNLDIGNFGFEYYEPEEFFEQEEYGTIRTYK